MDLTPAQFEQLLCEFCKQDLPPDFTVEHDIKDTGGESGNKRQIDTKIKGRLGISDILICGESKNWAEPVGIETIDSLVGKYLSGEIRANKVIVFSKQGFTAPAVKRATILGIELLEPMEIGKPIQQLPFVVAVGYLDQMMISMSNNSPQHNLMSHPDNYVLLKGAEKISFSQNLYRIILDRLRRIPNKDIYSDLSKMNVEDHNVMYEIKQKEGYRYNANFEVEVCLKWDYFYQFLPEGVLKHVNSGKMKLVNLQGNPEQVLRK